MEPSNKKSAKTARLPPEGSGQTPARETLALEKLVTDAGTQVRAEISEYIVGEYVDALGEGARFPPVVVFRGKGADVLADGFHRVRAYQQAGRSEIEADVYQGDRDDALWFRVTRRPSLRSESSYGPCGPGWTGASRPSTASRRMRDEQSTGRLGRARSRGAAAAAHAGAFGCGGIELRPFPTHTCFRRLRYASWLSST